MPLTREQKTAEVEGITSQVGEIPALYLTDYKGLTVDQINELRQRFRESGVEYKVVKNTLLRRALEGLGGYEDLLDHLRGPTAMALSEEPAAPARVIKKFTSDNKLELPELKVAFIDGALYGGDQIDALAALKSKTELLGDILGLLMAPMANIMGALQAPGANLASILAALQSAEEEAE